MRTGSPKDGSHYLGSRAPRLFEESYIVPGQFDSPGPCSYDEGMYLLLPDIGRYLLTFCFLLTQKKKQLFQYMKKRSTKKQKFSHFYIPKEFYPTVPLCTFPEITPNQFQALEHTMSITRQLWNIWNLRFYLASTAFIPFVKIWSIKFCATDIDTIILRSNIV